MTNSELAEIQDNLLLDDIPNRHQLAVLLLREAFAVARATKDVPMMLKIAELLSPETTIYRKEYLRTKAKLTAKAETSESRKMSNAMDRLGSMLQDNLRKSSDNKEPEEG